MRNFLCWFYGFQLSLILITVIQSYILSSLIRANSNIIFFLCNTILSLFLGLEFAHSLREASSSPPSFPFPLRSTTELLLGKKLWPMVNPTKSWPRALDGWVAWVTRLSLYFRGLWIALGIEWFIHLITINTSLDVELMSIALKFWSKSINSFMLPFGPMSITLRDITVLTGLPI